MCSMDEIFYNEIPTNGFENKSRYTVEGLSWKKGAPPLFSWHYHCNIRQGNVLKCTPHVQYDLFFVLVRTIVSHFGVPVAVVDVIGPKTGFIWRYEDMNQIKDTLVDHWSCSDSTKPFSTTFWVHVTKLRLIHWRCYQISIGIYN